jgi:3-hydroxyisobutyrate dehydrogenase
VHRIAFAGTGLMGARMVKRLLAAGFDVRVFNRTRAKLEPLLALGARAEATPAAAADGADLLCLCLTDKAAVEAVLFGPEGLHRAGRPPPLAVDFSTIGPGPTLELAERLRRERGTAWVDAPVSGGATGAESGKLVIFCGGAQGDIERLAPVFAPLAQRVTRVGPLGAGQTLKLCNQLIVATNLVAIAESLNLARDNGLDLKIIPDALAGGFADSIPMQIFGRRMAEGVTTPILGELGLMLKDLNAVADLGREHGSELPMSRTAIEVYLAAGRRGLLDQDLSALISYFSR